MNITKTLSALSKSSRPISDTEMLKWANTTVQKAKPSTRPPRSFKDPSLTTGLFFLDLLDAISPGIVDPALVIDVREDGDYEHRRQNGGCSAFIHLLPIQTVLILSKIGHLDCKKDERSDISSTGGHCRCSTASGKDSRFQ
jgi:hypothetical protein